MKPKNKGLQTQPDKRGKVKQCNPDRSFPCGKACLSIASDILSRCQKNLLKSGQNKAMKLLEQLKPLSLVENTKLSTEEERQAFKESLPSEKQLPPSLAKDFDSEVRLGLMTQEKFDQYKNKTEITEKTKNPPYIEELISLKNYTMGGYKPYNQHLRDSMSDSTKTYIEPHLKSIELSIKMAESALESMPNFSGIAKRATALNRKTYDFYKNNIGKEISEKGFLSATTSQDMSAEELLNNFVEFSSESTRVVFIINSKNGKSVKELSEYPDEEEIMFKPNSKFKIKSIQENNKYKLRSGNESTYSIVFLEESD